MRPTPYIYSHNINCMILKVHVHPSIIKPKVLQSNRKFHASLNLLVSIKFSIINNRVSFQTKLLIQKMYYEPSVVYLVDS